MNSLKNIIFFTLIINIVSKFNDTVNATVTQTAPLSEADKIEVQKCVEEMKAEFKEVGLNDTSIYMSYAFFAKDRASFVSNYRLLFFDYVVNKIVPGENFNLPGDYCTAMYAGMETEFNACQNQLQGTSNDRFVLYDQDYKTASDKYKQSLTLMQNGLLKTSAIDGSANQSQKLVEMIKNDYNMAVKKRRKSIVMVACNKITLDDILRNPILHMYMLSVFRGCTLVQDEDFLKFDALCGVNPNYNSPSNERILE